MSASVTAWATVVLVVVTAVLAYVTWLLARVNYRPLVVATFDPFQGSINFINIHVRNEGTAAAYDVKVEVRSKTVDCTDDGPLARVPKRISMLMTGQSLVCGVSHVDELIDHEFTIRTSWANSPKAKRRHSLQYQYDFGGMLKIGRYGSDPAYETAEMLKAISITLEKIAAKKIP